MSHSYYFVTVLLPNITLRHFAEFFFMKLFRNQMGNSGWACFWQKPLLNFNLHTWQGMKAAEYTITSCTLLKKLKQHLEPGSVFHLQREGERIYRMFLWCSEVCLGTAPCSGLDRLQHVAHSPLLSFGWFPRKSLFWELQEKVIIFYLLGNFSIVSARHRGDTWGSEDI